MLNRLSSQLQQDIFIWFLLVGFTVVSWAVGASDDNFSAVTSTSIILVVSFVKVRLVARYFMEVKTAPLWLRVAIDGWCVFVCLGLLAILFLP